MLEVAEGAQAGTQKVQKVRKQVRKVFSMFAAQIPEQSTVIRLSALKVSTTTLGIEAKIDKG